MTDKLEFGEGQRKNAERVGSLTSSDYSACGWDHGMSREVTNHQLWSRLPRAGKDLVKGEQTVQKKHDPGRSLDFQIWKTRLDGELLIIEHYFMCGGNTGKYKIHPRRYVKYGEKVMALDRQHKLKH